MSEQFGKVALWALAAMMFITCIDILMRSFGYPVAGIYEVVGYIGAIAVSFALPRTTATGGHIAVDIVVARFPERVQSVIRAVVSLLGLVLFIIITWQCVVMGFDLVCTGEVSPTLQIPFFPFVFGVACGCAATCLVLLSELMTVLEEWVVRK
ncbi:MAG: TRAP transporter small permease [Dehalococcoidia bacterium]|nr:TRAP transporter small permease [Dehalococcoidia bacterium]